MASQTAPQPAPRRVRKRILIPSVLLAIAALAGAWLWWRGTFADTTVRNPASAAEGAVTQLVSQDGRTFVRSAIIVDAPPKDVWNVITDYDSHPRFIRYIAELSSRKLDDGRVRLIGVAHSRLWGDFAFEVDVTHDVPPPEGEYAATWHEENKSGFVVNRGGWELKPFGTGQTLVVFSKQSELAGYPNFVIRNILLDRLGAIVRAVRDETLKRRHG